MNEQVSEWGFGCPYHGSFLSKDPLILKFLIFSCSSASVVFPPSLGARVQAADIGATCIRGGSLSTSSSMVNFENRQ